jgi:hypothetical protein
VRPSTSHIPQPALQAPPPARHQPSISSMVTRVPCGHLRTTQNALAALQPTAAPSSPPFQRRTRRHTFPAPCLAPLPRGCRAPSRLERRTLKMAAHLPNPSTAAHTLASTRPSLSIDNHRCCACPLSPPLQPRYCTAACSLQVKVCTPVCCRGRRAVVSLAAASAAPTVSGQIGETVGQEWLQEDYVQVGTLGKVHGIRGEVVVTVETSFEEERFGRPGVLCVTRPGCLAAPACYGGRVRSASSLSHARAPWMRACAERSPRLAVQPQ